MQIVPFPEYPRLQIHDTFPDVLIHAAFTSQRLPKHFPTFVSVALDRKMHCYHKQKTVTKGAFEKNKMHAYDLQRNCC